jgi:FMN phosphatase YigB (HAD superfamily)
MKGIIFDFNGTLAQKTKSLESTKFCEFLRETGCDVYYQEWEAAYRYVYFVEYPKGGIDSYGDLLNAVFRALGSKPSGEVIVQGVEYWKSNDEYEAYPDIESVRKLEVNKAILTTIPRFKFQNLKLDGFDPIMTGKEIGRAKPHPDGFLKILAKWNMGPSEVLMIGDDVDCDILPAKELGLRTAFIGRKGKTCDEADYSISSLEEIPEIIR